MEIDRIDAILSRSECSSSLSDIELIDDSNLVDLSDSDSSVDSLSAIADIASDDADSKEEKESGEEKESWTTRVSREVPRSDSDNDTNSASQLRSGSGTKEG